MWPFSKLGRLLCCRSRTHRSSHCDHPESASSRIASESNGDADFASPELNGRCVEESWESLNEKEKNLELQLALLRSKIEKARIQKLSSYADGDSKIGGRRDKASETEIDENVKTVEDIQKKILALIREAPMQEQREIRQNRMLLEQNGVKGAVEWENPQDLLRNLRSCHKLQGSVTYSNLSKHLALKSVSEELVQPGFILRKLSERKQKSDNSHMNVCDAKGEKKGANVGSDNESATVVLRNLFNRHDDMVKSKTEKVTLLADVEY
mmetsp:Transcript_21830/g.53440  ORF Transcript_21830/g.53440 Transcript_21830/m.53440 type:complete len:267 (+) Transcript_21830:64-864(+)